MTSHVPEATLTETHRTGRPWALLWLWLALMAPLSLMSPVVQPLSGIDDRVLPLIMVGPALAWLICRVVVPHWFPRSPTPLGAGSLWRPLVAATVTSAVWLVTLWAVDPGGPMVVPEGPRAAAVAAVIVGLVVGAWCEEVGYRGVMYRAMASRWGTWATILVNGLVFGLAHLQYLGDGPLPVLLFLATAVLLDLAMAATWAGSWQQRVVTATILHAAVNIGFQLHGVTLDTTRAFLSGLLATAVAALVAVVVGRMLRVGDLGGQTPRPGSGGGPEGSIPADAPLPHPRPGDIVT